MSARTHYRVFNERTGKPVKDNDARHANKRLSDMRYSFRLKGVKGWKRKKRLSHETYVQLVELTISVMRQLHDERVARETAG